MWEGRPHFHGNKMAHSTTSGFNASALSVHVYLYRAVGACVERVVPFTP